MGHGNPGAYIPSLEGRGFTRQLINSIASPTLTRFKTIARLRRFQLPGAPGDEHVIGVSGGADSTVLAILLDALFPNTPFHFLFTDTQAEARGTLESLERLEHFTRRTIERIAQPDGLYGLINHFNGFLPSHKQRWCTRILKVELSENWMESLRGKRDITIHNYAGLRADEPERLGFDPTMPWLHTHFPLRELGLRRQDVFAILEETVGVPTFYRGKSRSGCAICPFMRSSEVLAACELAPNEFSRAEQVERLSPEDQARFSIKGKDMSAVRMSYPIPPFIDIRTAALFDEERPMPARLGYLRQGGDLFDNQRVALWVGIEYLSDPMMALYGGSQTGTPGVWHSQLVCWSTTRGGLSRKLNMHYHSRLDSCEVFGLNQTVFKEQYGLAVFHVELPANKVDLRRTGPETFAWRRDEPLAKLRQIASAIKHLMIVENHKSTVREYAAYQNTPTWEGEQYAYSAAQMDQSRSEDAGLLLGTYRFIPGARTNTQTADKTPCFACSR